MLWQQGKEVGERWFFVCLFVCEFILLRWTKQPEATLKEPEGEKKETEVGSRTARARAEGGERCREKRRKIKARKRQ